MILRDIDLLKQCKNLKVLVSINTLDEKFKKHINYFYHKQLVEAKLNDAHF